MRKSRRGQVIVIFALCLLVLLGFAALAIDVGYLLSVRGELQRSADAGALAGAYVFHDGAWEKDDIPKDLEKKADLRARTVASRDPVGGTPLKADPTGGEIGVVFEKGAVNQIQVNTQRNVDLFFAGIFGVPAVTITASAKAAAEPVDQDVICLTPLAIPYESGLKQKDEEKYKFADPSRTVQDQAGKKRLFPLRFCGDSIMDFFGRIADPCNPARTCPFRVGDPVAVMPPFFFIPSHQIALIGIWQLAFNPGTGDPDSEWEKWEKDLPGSSKFKEDTWMYSPRVIRVMLYDKDFAELTGTIRAKGFAAYWIGWEESDRADIWSDIWSDPDDVEVEGHPMHANAVGKPSGSSPWPPNFKIPSLKITRLVQ